MKYPDHCEKHDKHPMTEDLDVRMATEVLGDAVNSKSYGAVAAVFLKRWAPWLITEISRLKNELEAAQAQVAVLVEALTTIRDHEPPFLGTDCRMVAGKVLSSPSKAAREHDERLRENLLSEIIVAAKVSYECSCNTCSIVRARAKEQKL